MKTFKEFISETKVIGKAQGTDIIEFPNASAMANILRKSKQKAARVMLLDKKWIAWDAKWATHSMIFDALGLNWRDDKVWESGLWKMTFFQPEKAGPVSIWADDSKWTNKVGAFLKRSDWQRMFAPKTNFINQPPEKAGFTFNGRSWGPQ